MFEQLFGSRTRVKLLTLFLLHPEESFYVREITRKIGEQINSVRRELANLHSLGLVKSRERDRRLYYQVNPRHAYYQELHQLFQRVREIPTTNKKEGEDELVTRFRALGNVQFAMLAGTFLKKQSVVDIFLVGDINKVKLSKLVTDLEHEMGQELNFTVMTPDEYFYRRSLYDRFLGEVLDSDKMVLIDQLGAISRRRAEETA